jgi:hypothetical protein
MTTAGYLSDNNDAVAPAQLLFKQKREFTSFLPG